MVLIPPYQFIGMYMPEEWRVYSFTQETAEWILQQPDTMWKRIESSSNNIISYRYPYAVSPELDAWIKLKWG